MKQQSKPLSLHVLGGYGVMTIPLAVSGLPVLIFLPAYFAQDVGLELGLLGLVLMLTRVFDMVSDPIIGSLSDNNRSRFGRRRPWILAGVVLMMMATAKVFLASDDIDLLGVGVWLALFYLGWTMITVPYTAWGLELSRDYHERSRVAGARELFSVLGMIAVFVVAGVVTEELPEGVSETPSIVKAMGWMTLMLLPVCCGILFFSVREVEPDSCQRESMLETLAQLSSNRPFLLLMTAALVTELGVAINNSVLLIFYDNVVGLEARVDDLVATYFVAALVGVPMWLWFEKLLDKHRAMCLAAVWNALSLWSLMFIDSGEFEWYAMVEVSRGLAFAGPLILGASMVADVVEFDSWKRGRSSGGVVAACWITGSKFAAAIGVGIALPALAWIGFDASAENTDQVLKGVTTIYAVIPGLLGLLAIPFLWNYPLTASRSRVVKRALERRNEREELLLVLPY